MALAREDETRDRTGFVYKFCRQAPDLYATVLSFCQFPMIWHSHVLITVLKTSFDKTVY